MAGAIVLTGGCVVGPAPEDSSRAPRDTVVVGVSAEPETLFLPSLDPNAITPATQVAGAIHLPLTQRDEKNEYLPRLAARVPTLENGLAAVAKDAGGKDQLTVRYEIREGAKFSDGSPVTSDDVKFSWELALNNDAPIASRATAQRYLEIRTPDAQTVEVVYRSGQLDPLYSTFCCWIVSRRTVGSVDPKTIRESQALNRSPVSNGAYRVAEWSPGSSIRLEAVEDFVLGTPKTRSVVFRFFSDPNTLLSLVREDQVQVATSDAVGPDQIPAVERSVDAGVTPRYSTMHTWEHLDFNLGDPTDPRKPHPILGEPTVRHAIAHAIDRPRIAQQLFFGKASPIHSFLFGPSWAAATESQLALYPFDRSKATRLLEEAGWIAGADGVREKSGRQLELKLQSTSSSKLREQISAEIAADLQAVGIKVTRELIPATHLFATGGGGPLSARSFDLALFAWIQQEDPQSFVYICDQTPTSANGFRGQNFTGYCNPAFDKVMLDANGRLSREERLPLYLEAQSIWTKDLPVLPLFPRLRIDVASGKLRNLKTPPTSTPLTFNAFEWELLAP
jgi:peptide/nickel transport system substrate-binding protein